MATVNLKDVYKRYGRTEVIHGINLDIRDGEFLVIVGPSGCGKSTLLRMVAGLEAVSDGDISIDGKVVNKLEPRERDVAMVFQNYALYPHMSVFNNMAYGLKIAGLSKTETKQRVEKAAKTLDLSDLLKRKPSELSGGQRQRVAMGRAIVREPRLFLFDEPLSNLDAKLRVQMRLEIKQLQMELGTTALYVTHDQTEAMTLADRLVVMNGGYAEQIDQPMTVFEKPATTFVAGFIGSPPMNLITGSLRRPDNGIADHGIALQCSSGLSLPLPNQPAGDYSSDEVTVGIRPDALQISSAKEPANADVGAVTWPVKVLMIEPLGSDSLIHCQLQRHGNPPFTDSTDSTDSNERRAKTNASDGAMQTFTVRCDTGTAIHAGSTAWLTIEPSALHWFDASSGRRIEEM